jgi:hypothetical protein
MARSGTRRPWAGGAVPRTPSPADSTGRIYLRSPSPAANSCSTSLAGSTSAPRSSSPPISPSVNGRVALPEVEDDAMVSLAQKCFAGCLRSEHAGLTFDAEVAVEQCCATRRTTASERWMLRCENQDATCRTMSNETLVSLLTASQWGLVGLTALFAWSR